MGENEGLEEDIERYLTAAIGAVEEVRTILDQKEMALKNHDFHESLRLCGVLGLMAKDMEEIEMRMDVVVGGGPEQQEREEDAEEEG